MPNLITRYQQTLDTRPNQQEAARYLHGLDELAGWYAEKNLTVNRSNLNSKTLRRWRTSYRATHSLHMTNQTLGCIRHFLLWSAAENLTESGLADLLPAFKGLTVTEQPIANEIRQLLRYSRDHASRRDYALIALLAQSGLKSGQISRLKGQDVLNEENTLSVSERLIPLNRLVSQALQAWLERWPLLNSPYLFPNPNGQPLTTRAIQKISTRQCSQAHLSRLLSPAMLRQAVIRQLSQHGGNATDIAYLTALRRGSLTDRRAPAELSTLIEQICPRWQDYWPAASA